METVRGPSTPERSSSITAALAKDEGREQSCAEGLEPPPIALEWAALGEHELAERVDPHHLELVVRNQTGALLKVRLRFEADAGTPSSVRVGGPTFVVDAREAKTITFDLAALDLPVEKMRTSGMLFSSAEVFDAEGQQLISAVSAPLFWHSGTAKPSLDPTMKSGLTVYDERTHEQRFQGGAALRGDAVLPTLEGDQPSRVFFGDVAIVTKGRTTPKDLEARGLLKSANPVVDDVVEEN